MGIEKQQVSGMFTPSRKTRDIVRCLFLGEGGRKRERKGNKIITTTEMHVSLLRGYLSVIRTGNCCLISFCLTVILVLVITRKIKRPRLILVSEYPDGD